VVNKKEIFLENSRTKLSVLGRVVENGMQGKIHRYFALMHPLRNLRFFVSFFSPTMFARGQ